jgi:hypothetical protein
VAEGVLQLGTKAEVLSLIPLGHAFFAALNSTLTSEKFIRWGFAEYAHGLNVRPWLVRRRRNIGLSIKDPTGSVEIPAVVMTWPK